MDLIPSNDTSGHAMETTYHPARHPFCFVLQRNEFFNLLKLLQTVLDWSQQFLLKVYSFYSNHNGVLGTHRKQFSTLLLSVFGNRHSSDNIPKTKLIKPLTSLHLYLLAPTQPVGKQALTISSHKKVEVDRRKR